MRFLRFIGFTIVRAWQGFWRNAMMSLAATATVVLMLVLLSGLVIVVTALNSGLRFIEQKVAVPAPLNDGLRADARDGFLAEVAAEPGFGRVSYVSPGGALGGLGQTY